MLEEEARALLEDHVNEGGRIVPAMTAELRSIKGVYERCLDTGVPALLGSCAGGG